MKRVERLERLELTKLAAAMPIRIGLVGLGTAAAKSGCPIKCRVRIKWCAVIRFRAMVFSWYPLALQGSTR